MAFPTSALVSVKPAHSRKRYPTSKASGDAFFGSSFYCSGAGAGVAEAVAADADEADAGINPTLWRFLKPMVAIRSVTQQVRGSSAKSSCYQ
jgi:hypothetical protein